MDILLIRHAETDPGSRENYNGKKNRFDPPLNERGRAQAELLGRRLAGSRVGKIISSDLTRAADTAQAANRYLDAPIELREELREIDMGMLHGRTWEQLRVELPEQWAAWHRHETDVPYPGGESGGDAAARAMAAVGGILRAGLDSVAVVTHGGIIRILICAMLGIGQEKRFLFNPPRTRA